jgi:signal transduction histidine kinase
MDPTAPISAEAERFRAALCAGLETPLLALRASLEALVESESGNTAVEGALREVLHLARGVQELGEFAAPPVPKPLGCSATEIAYSARYQLGREQRERVWIAREGASSMGSLWIDGPLLSRALARLLMHVLESGTERALLRARRDGDDIVFVVVGDSRSIDPDVALVPFSRAYDRSLGLGLYLTRRDLEVLDGGLALVRGPLGDTCFVARVPHQPVPR